MDHAFSKSFPSAKTLVEENQPFIIFFFLKSPTFWFWQNFVSVFKKALRQSVSTYHKDKWFPTSGCSPIHFRFVASSQVEHTTQITQDTLCVVKDGGQRRMKIYGKISAQPHPTLCIQFLNRENNDKNNTFPLGKQICFTIVWGCAETLPNLPEIMSSKGKDNRRISGLAKPLADCKIEVRF